MNKSVWKEQVDEGFLKYLPQIIFIDNQPIKTIIRTPDTDFSKETYPMVSVTSIFDSFSPLRYEPQTQVVSRSNNIATIEDSAVPFDLYYQIDFYSTLQEDMGSITSQWLNKHFKWFNLPVLDASGEERSCLVTRTSDLIKQDDKLNSKRLFHSLIRLKVCVELDNPETVHTPVVLEVDITP